MDVAQKSAEINLGIQAATMADLAETQRMERERVQRGWEAGMKGMYGTDLPAPAEVEPMTINVGDTYITQAPASDSPMFSAAQQAAEPLAEKAVAVVAPVAKQAGLSLGKAALIAALSGLVPGAGIPLALSYFAPKPAITSPASQIDKNYQLGIKVEPIK